MLAMVVVGVNVVITGANHSHAGLWFVCCPFSYLLWSSVVVVEEVLVFFTSKISGCEKLQILYSPILL